QTRAVAARVAAGHAGDPYRRHAHGGGGGFRAGQRRCRAPARPPVAPAGPRRRRVVMQAAAPVGTPVDNETERRLHPWSWLFVLVQQLKQFLVPLLALLVF